MEKNRKNIFLKDIETKTLNIKEYQVILTYFDDEYMGTDSFEKAESMLQKSACKAVMYTLCRRMSFFPGLTRDISVRDSIF